MAEIVSLQVCMICLAAEAGSDKCLFLDEGMVQGWEKGTRTSKTGLWVWREKVWFLPM